MHLDLTQLREGRLEGTFRIPPDDALVQGLDGRLLEPLRLDVELTDPTHGTFILTGRLSVSIEEPCRRCLEPVREEVEKRFRVVYKEPGREARASDEPADEDIVWIEPGARTIEFDGRVRELVFLETDRFPLCRPECRGLCPICGQDLNVGRCDCEFETVDHRWSALASLSWNHSEESTDGSTEA